MLCLRKVPTSILQARAGVVVLKNIHLTPAIYQNKLEELYRSIASLQYIIFSRTKYKVLLRLANNIKLGMEYMLMENRRRRVG
jgi:hypothetical protein